jgi:hypothetical protein
LRKYFYKYTDIETAEATLVNQSFRYSSPLKFNDPFDVQNNLRSSFDLEDFPAATMSVIESYVNNDFPIPNENNGFGKAIMMLREGTKHEGYKKSKIEAITVPLLGEVKGLIEKAIEELNHAWQTSMRESRVFCVTEDNDNLLMWAHYAKDHTGAVFQLDTLSEEDNILSAARKVDYKESPVKFLSLEDLIKWTLFEIEPDLSKLLYIKHAHQKSVHWKYENEWRVVDMCEYSNKTELYVDHIFTPKQLKKIFFGCKCDSDDIERLSSLAKSINPSVDLYKAKKKPLEYALEFDKI